MRYSYYLDWVVIWLIHIGHGPLLLTIHCVVVFTVLVLNRIHNTLSAFKSKLESQLRPSIAPLHHCFDLFTRLKRLIKWWHYLWRMNHTAIALLDFFKCLKDAFFFDSSAAIINQNRPESQLEGVVGCRGWKVQRMSLISGYK